MIIPINTVENLRGYLRRKNSRYDRYSKTDFRSCTSGTNKGHKPYSMLKLEKTSIDWVKNLLQRIEQKHTGLVFPKYDDYYMERVIFDDLFEDREVSEFARNELEFDYYKAYINRTEAGSTLRLWIPPKTIEKIRNYLKRAVENQNSSLF